MADIDDLLNDINSVPSKKGKKKGGAKKDPEEKKIEETKKEETIDDLLNDINSAPSKKGKKNEPKKEEPKEEQGGNIDDLLNDINSVPSKKGKKKGPAVKKEEQQIPEDKQENNDNKNNKKDTKIEEPIKIEEDEKKEEDDDDEDEEKDDKEEKGEKKVKKKKIVKKKKGKEDKFAKLIQEEQKKRKELQERLQKEAEEEERLRRIEEERLRKEEEERIAKEDEEKRKEQERLNEYKKYGFKSVQEINELNQKKQRTEDEIKKLGFNSLDEYLDSFKTQTIPKKIKKKKVEKVETIKPDDEYIPKNEEAQYAENVQEEEKIESLTKHVEENQTFEINKIEDIDDWENYVEDDQGENIKKDETEKIIETDNDKNICSENKKNKPKPKVIQQEPEENIGKLRSPIICILGHVDTGKTKILDKLRKSNVQEGEAGGITQQIGATFFPIENFTQHLNKIPEKFRIDPKIPGFLVIDTPGHESFQNLRLRGSSLCDLAILVVDLMHGLEKTTLDSLELLKKRRTPFIIALNKIDRVYQWKSTEWGGFRDSYEKQKKSQTKEFNDRLKQVITSLIQQNLNVAIYDENPSMKEYINIVPTSAITGEGMPDLIGMFVYLSQKFLMKKLVFKEEVQCTILEVKVLEKTGTTIDVILVNGTLKVGDKIIIGGLFGPIKTTIKILLTPHPMKEMRIKSEYEQHESISGSMGIKIFANDLENALAGSPLYVYKTDEEAEKYSSEITSDFNSIIKDFLSKSGKGIMVQASTLGSLEAILTYLHEQKIEIAVVGLGNLQKKDVIKIQTIHSSSSNKLKEHYTILAFDIKILPEAKQYAEDNHIKIFTADIIYHLFNNYVEYEKQCINERKKEKEREAIFPCSLKIVPGAVFNRKDPIIIGVDIVEGILKVGTPLIVPEKKLLIGVVEGIESNKKQVNNVRSKDGSVAIRIKPADSSITVGRQFEETDKLVSNISRNSINSLKEFFKEDMTTDDWKLVISLKKMLEII